MLLSLLSFQRITLSGVQFFEDLGVGFELSLQLYVQLQLNVQLKPTTLYSNGCAQSVKTFVCFPQLCVSASTTRRFKVGIKDLSRRQKGSLCPDF